MRVGKWRGMTLAIVLGTVTVMGTARTASAGLFSHAIPRETLAYDSRTGGPSYAPPIPFGEYAKDYVGGVKGCLTAPIHGLIGRFCTLCGKGGCKACGGLGHHQNKACGLCGGDGCTHCQGGAGKHGGGLFHHGPDDPCGACGGAGCGLCATTGGNRRHFSLSGLHGAKGGSLCGAGQNCASAQTAPTGHGAAIASGQASVVLPCGQCQGSGCGRCGGRGFLAGHGLFQGHGASRACGICGGRGVSRGGLCGGCGGHGFLKGHGGDPCGACGGAGCARCLGKIHSILGKPHAMLSSLIHHGDVKYFVGPGGPVPITPGYVPYVVTTRSPRDYFAFPPFVDTLP